jgi:pilus assembly protein CpaB
MRAKSMALLMLALGCGLVASIGSYQVLAKRNTEPVGIPGETAPVVVAVTDIPLGEPLSPEMMKLEPWPKDKVPPGAIANLEDVQGRRAKQRLYSGEPILENKLLIKGASMQGASSVIPMGYRVVSVKVDSVSGSGLILPGDRVDVLVYLVGNSQQEIQETSARTVLQDIKVFAVDDIVNMDKDKDGKDKCISAKTISLLVTPPQAAKVTLASEMGKIRLVMRSPDDNAHTEDATAKPEELLGRSAYSNRDKENSLDKNFGEKKGFVDFLRNANSTPIRTPPPVTAAPQTVTWTMRIIQPNGINDVVMETENPSASNNTDSGHWRINSGEASGPGGKSAGNQTKKEESIPPLPGPSMDNPSPETPAVPNSTTSPEEGNKNHKIPPEPGATTSTNTNQLTKP